ncbi:K02A2.6-like [Cordylochernes scorpioides]|uniref:RNA-directed DNA polymerase n=1 Tax=Cordylochernes scorpioides TaxID=51811 RepID=A0ABY6K0W6_9ARAC|nr:K02A2.6-like [Cordylochernes scorpioides]
MDRKFTIFSDHHALPMLKTVKNPSGRIFRWRLRLSRYEYEVRYINGVQQYETDVITRNPFCGFSDASLIKNHQPSPSGNSSLTIGHNGLHTISRKGVTKIMIPKTLTNKLLQTVHTQYNHPNISKMTRLISAQYYWQNMSQDIAQQVKTCPTCQLTKRIDRPNQPLQRDTDTVHINKLKLYTENIQYITPPTIKIHHLQHNDNNTFPFRHLTPELFPAEPLTIKPTNSEPFNHLDPTIFTKTRFTPLTHNNKERDIAHPQIDAVCEGQPYPQTQKKTESTAPRAHPPFHIIPHLTHMVEPFIRNIIEKAFLQIVSTRDFVYQKLD